MNSSFFQALVLCLFLSTFPAAATNDESVELRNIYARNHDLGRLLNEDVKASVFVFLRPGCPVVDLAIPHLKKLYQQYRPQKVAFYAIYSNTGINLRSMAIHAQQMDLPLRAYLDVNQKLAKHWGVKRTAETVVVDSKGSVLYKGAIMDGERVGTEQGLFLRDALDDHLAKKEVRTKSTLGQGCVINMRPPVYSRGLTFHKDILPIVQAKCQRCHRPGEVAPMPLFTYDDVSSYAPMIAQVVEDRTMPPWPAVSHLPIKDNAALTDEEVRKFLGWIAEDAPEGNEADAPRPLSWPDPEKWQIGEPDMVFESRSFTVPETGIVPYIYTRKPIGADQDLFLEALEVKPSARRAMHHTAIHEFPYSDKPITAVDLVKIYGLEISNNILGAYVPGIRPRKLPPGHAIRIKKGMGVLIDAHYTTFGKEVTDVTRLGIKVSKTPPKREVFSRWFYRSRGRFMIPKGAEHHVMERDDISFDRDIEILGIRPHLHARGKSFQVEKMSFLPGKEKSEVVLALPRWDFNWQYDYMFETPLKLNGGEALKIKAAWDNTDFNPTNPDPKVDVQFGEQTQDEMMGILLIWRNADEKAEVK